MAKKPTPPKPETEAPHTTSEAVAAPAPETTQEHAGAGDAGAARSDAADAAEPTPATIVALIVTSKVEGFRRAGLAWGREATRVEVADLADDQVEALFAEPMLDVVGVAE